MVEEEERECVWLKKKRERVCVEEEERESVVEEEGRESVWLKKKEERVCG